MAAYDDPFVGRFRFASDGGMSDEDGLYMSTAGAFMCDNIKVYDYYSGYVFFYDDAEGDGVVCGGLCNPSNEAPAAVEERSWGVIKAMYR